MSIRDIILPRMDPSILDPADGHQRELIDLFLTRYRFAAIRARGRRVLDIPCSVGYGCELLVREGGAAAVTGLDFEEDAIADARRKYPHPDIEYRLVPFEDWGVTGPYDLICCMDSVAHVPDPRTLFSRVKTLLAPGGDVIAAAHITPTTDFNTTHRHDFTRNSFLRHLTREGFIIHEEFMQIQRYAPARARELMKVKHFAHESGRPPRNLLTYYLRHPLKALDRVRSLIVDGFAIKTLIVRARLPEPMA